ENTSCLEDGAGKRGFLIKSPPPHLFSSQSSWKKRFFILSKSRKGNYILKYLKGQNLKGSIDVDKIINIEVGISNSETMEMVRKMFKCLPEQVMSLSTGNRCYYLIGSSRQEIEDWVAVISSVRREAERSGCCPEVTTEGVLVFSSHKVVYKWPIWRKLDASEAPLEQNDPSEDKNRPNSDPGPNQAPCDSPRGVFPSLMSRRNQTARLVQSAEEGVKNLGRSEENLLSLVADEDVKKGKDDYYQTPSSVLAKVVYHCQLTCRCDGLLNPPKHQDSDACPRDLKENRDLKLPESSTSQQPTLQRRQNSLPLSVVRLTILLSQITDETQLQKLDIFVPLADINSYLKLTEAAGQI
ncbi:PKHS1 protein, partial [Ceuthmochares aereus]|nr:PKHS1 protein [Ceuthmochares aereus]